jgi:hypothetical protein
LGGWENRQAPRAPTRQTHLLEGLRHVRFKRASINR